jgi:hypothetical protein
MSRRLGLLRNSLGPPPPPPRRYFAQSSWLAARGRPSQTRRASTLTATRAAGPGGRLTAAQAGRLGPP